MKIVSKPIFSHWMMTLCNWCYCILLDPVNSRTSLQVCAFCTVKVYLTLCIILVCWSGAFLVYVCVYVSVCEQLHSVSCLVSGSVALGGYVTASSVPDWHLPGVPFVCWSITSASYSVLFAGSHQNEMGALNTGWLHSHSTCHVTKEGTVFPHPVWLCFEVH